MAGGTGAAPGEMEKILSDPKLMEDMEAVMDKSTDLLVKHGMFIHERGGLRPAPRFIDMWMEADGGGPGTLHESLAAAVSRWTGGAVDGPVAASMCVAIVTLIGGTEVGRMMDAEAARLNAGRGGMTHEGVRGEVGRTRAGLEAERL